MCIEAPYNNHNHETGAGIYDSIMESTWRTEAHFVRLNERPQVKAFLFLFTY
jgi:hypothetical protein